MNTTAFTVSSDSKVTTTLHCRYVCVQNKPAWGWKGLPVDNNLFFKRLTPITLKSILPSGPLKTKLIIINYNSRDKKPIYK